LGVGFRGVFSEVREISTISFWELSLRRLPFRAVQLVSFFASTILSGGMQIRSVFLPNDLRDGLHLGGFFLSICESLAGRFQIIYCEKIRVFKAGYLDCI
jgi:hypothetical protein